MLLHPWNFPGKNTGVGYHFLFQGIFLTQGSNPHILCLLHWQMGSLPLAPPGKPLLTLRERESESRSVVSDSLQPHGLYKSMEFSRILEWVAMPSSKGVFSTQGLNPGLPHCRQILHS